MKKLKHFSPTSGQTRSSVYAKSPIRAPKRKSTITSVSTLTDDELTRLDEALGDEELLKSALENADHDVAPDDRDGAGASSLNKRFTDKVTAKLLEPLAGAIEVAVARQLSSIVKTVDAATTVHEPTVAITGGPARFHVKRRNPKLEALKDRTKVSAGSVKNEIVRDEHGRPEYILEHHPDGRTTKRTIVRDEQGVMVGTVDEVFEPEPKSPTLKRARAKP